MRYTARERAVRARWLREQGWYLVEHRRGRTVWRSPDRWDSVLYTLGLAVQREHARDAARRRADPPSDAERAVNARQLADAVADADRELTAILGALA
jgi:hypothetical protein